MSTDLKKTLKKLLSEGEVIVTFTKKNGEERVMSCTQDRQIIKERFNDFVEPTNKVERPEDLFVVWDLSKGDWRSFNWKQVKTFESNKICWEAK